MTTSLGETPAALQIPQQAFESISIDGSSSNSLSGTCLTNMSRADIRLRIIKNRMAIELKPTARISGGKTSQ